MTPRGLRNNNPGNVRISSTKWYGKIAGDDPSFETFDTAENGIRCMTKIFISYYFTHGLKTIHDMIARWAPSSENDTEAYSAAVAGECGIGPDVIFPIDDAALFAKFIKAVIRHENGQQPYSDQQILEGIRRAGA